MARLIDANVPLQKIQAEIERIQGWRDTKADSKCAALYIREIEKLDNWLGIYAECEDLIKFAPTVDAVEVVRCKDCKHGRQPWLEGQAMVKCMVGKTMLVTPEHFCSYGERRDNERKAD